MFSLYFLRCNSYSGMQVKWPEEGGHRVAQEGTVVLVWNPHLFLLNPTRDSLRKGKSFRGRLHNVSSDTSGADGNMYNAVLTK